MRKPYLLKNNTKKDAGGEVVVRIRIHRLFGEFEPGSRFDDQNFLNFTLGKAFHFLYCI